MLIGVWYRGMARAVSSTDSSLVNEVYEKIAGSIDDLIILTLIELKPLGV